MYRNNYKLSTQIKIILLIQFKIVKLFNGPYLHSQIISNFRKIKLKVFYMGSSEHVLNRIVDKLKIEAPLWDVETYSPPFTIVFSKDQNDIIINNVNKFKAGAVKQILFKWFML